MILYVDQETHGYKEEVATVEELKALLEEILDESVVEVKIKKRAVRTSSLMKGVKGCS